MPEEDVILDAVPDETPPVDDTPPADETPPTDDTPPAESTDDSDPARFTKRINEKTFEMHEQRRRADAAEAELARVRSEAAPAEAPVIPDLPDPYDANFEEKMAIRDKAISEASTFQAQQQAQQFQQQQAQQAQQREALRKQNETVHNYVERATKLGVTPEQLQTADRVITGYGGVHPDVEQFILNADEGPLITKYLAENPSEIETIRGLHPTVAAVRIATELVPKAKAAGGQSSAPAPVDTLGGGGAPPSEVGPSGATYE